MSQWSNFTHSSSIGAIILATSDKHLILNAKTLFTFDDQGDMLLVNDWQGDQLAPLFYLGRSAHGSICYFRSGLKSSLRQKLLFYVEREPNAASQLPVYADQYQRILAPVSQSKIWSGPAYYFNLDGLSSEAIVDNPLDNIVQIDSDNKHLLQSLMSEWLADVPYEQPMLAWVEDGVAVGICSSVRVTDHSMAAGAEVLASHRKKGIGAKIVTAWARQVHLSKRIAMYSTSDDNIGSQQLAASLGVTTIGSDFHIT